MNIEESIQDQVKLLRKNGFNITYSCDREMMIKCECYDIFDIDRISFILINSGYEKFRIELIYYFESDKSLLKELKVKFPISSYK